MSATTTATEVQFVGERLFSSLQGSPLFVGFVVLGALGTAWIIHDYKQWKALGTGGTPSNVYGYCRMTLFRILFAYHVPRQIVPETLRSDGPSFLKAPIPMRAGGRPELMPRILPQRQRPEPIDSVTKEKLMTLMSRLAREFPDTLESRLSITEGRTADGLYVRAGNPKTNPVVAADRRLNYELGHAHPADSSLHLWLSEADARKVIEACWGQRFCLPMVQKGWTMVYAPRNEEELAIIERFVRASIQWATGVSA